MENEKYIRLSDIQKYPIRINHYDKEHGRLDFVLGIESVFEFIDYIAPAEVAPVINARWMPVKKPYLTPYCSCCGANANRDGWGAPALTRRCHNCGAHMILEE